MNRDHLPCSACSRFVASNPGYCTGFDRPAEADDRPCVLFVAAGSLEARRGAKSGQELLAEFQRRDSRKH